MDLMTFPQFDANAMTIYDHDASVKLDNDYWCVVNTFRFYLGDMKSDIYVEVPKGYLTDGASIPRILWNIIPPWGEYGQSVIVHDYLCDYGIIMDHGEAVAIDRARTDKILKESLEVLRVAGWRRAMIMSGVNMHRILTRPGTNNITPNKAILELERGNHDYLSDMLIMRERRANDLG